MITRRASEVIRLALTMSQIQNTDSLSWRDKVDMLNQSYIRLYSDLNNNGDLYYSKEMIFDFSANGEIERKFKLPKDFWKLLLVGYKSNYGEIVPIERAPNAGQFFSGYRIVNNELIFTNYFLPGPLIVRYIAQPQTIAYPRPGIRIPGKESQACYDSFENKVILGGPDGITVYDIISNTNVNREINGTFILVISSGIIYAIKETGIFCFDYELNEVSTLEGTFDLYAHSTGWEPGIIVSVAGVVNRYVSGGALAESTDYWDFMDGTINKNGSSFLYTDDEEVIDISEIFSEIDSYVISDPFIYTNKGGTVKVYEDFQAVDIAPAIVGKGTRKGMVIGAEVNNETGYGVIFKDFYSGLNLLGFASDTVLNYPSNIFFDWLAADLAVKFRIALDIPTGELPALADDYHDTLMRGISRDSFQAQRINNSYGRVVI